MKNQNMIVGGVAIAIVAGGVGFAGGTTYQRSQLMSNFQNRGEGRPMMQGQNANTKMGGKQATQGVPGQMGRGGAIAGEVTAKDDKTITVKMSDGSSKNIVLSSATTYRMASESNLGNIEVGKTVAIFGTANSDGSTTATSIEINPAMMGQELKK